MGSKCFQSIFYKKNKDKQQTKQLLTQFKVVNHTLNDSSFLYFQQFFQMQSSLGYALQKGKHLKQIKDKLSYYYQKLNLYLNKHPFLLSLLQIEKSLKTKNKYYVCLQIQAVQLSHLTKSINISISNSKGMQIKKFSKQKLDKSKIFQVLVCFNYYAQMKEYITIKVNQLIATLDIAQISKQLVVLDLINLRNKGSLSPLGEIAIRVQCISNVEEWKNKNLKLLQSRKSQLQKTLNIQQTYLDSSFQVFLPNSLSTKRISRLSYYKDDDLQFVQLQC